MTHLDAKLRVSYRLGSLIITSHLGACLALYLSEIPLLAGVLLAIAVLWHAWYLFKRYIFLTHPNSIIGFTLNNQQWQLSFYAGGQQPVDLLADSFRHPLICCLIFSTAGGKRFKLPLLTDMLNRQQFRQLLLHLQLS